MPAGCRKYLCNYPLNFTNSSLNCLKVTHRPVSTGGAGAGGGEVGAACPFSLASGTGLTMNLRPAECTTCAVALGSMSETRRKSVHIIHWYLGEQQANVCSMAQR